MSKIVDDWTLAYNGYAMVLTLRTFEPKTPNQFELAQFELTRGQCKRLSEYLVNCAAKES